MKAEPDRFLQRLTASAIVLAFVVVGLGAFTRLVDAGLGCPDWPGCYGHLLWPQTEQQVQAAEALFPAAPVDQDKTWPEMVHRYFAGSLGLVILALAIISVRRQNVPKKLPVFLVGLVIVQALFGMWTVTLKLWPQVVTAHLLGGFSTLALLWLLLLRLRQTSTATTGVTIPSSLRGLAAVGLVFVVLQIALGGWTSSNYAALACIDFPTCHDTWLPETDFAQGFNFTQQVGPNYLGGLLDSEARTAIHFTHRVGALMVTVILFALAISLLRTGSRGLVRLGQVLLLALGCQVALGITNVVAILPLHIAVAHNLGGAVLLLVMVTVNYQLYRSRIYSTQNNLHNKNNKLEVPHGQLSI